MHLILAQASSGGGYMQFVMLGGMILIFWLFFIRPQQKKQKEQRKFIDEIKKGDTVVTTGGIHGKIAAVEGDTVVLEVDKGLKIKFEKAAISLDASKKYATPAAAAS
jgi:preprotein translocase subunit YajC